MEKEINFEEALEKLEKIVKELENKEINLEEAVKKYSEGLEISKLCADKLKRSEEVVLKKMSELGLDEIKKEDN